MNKKTALKKVLDFVERWNKQDIEADVAEAARILEERDFGKAKDMKYFDKHVPIKPDNNEHDSSCCCNLALSEWCEKHVPFGDEYKPVSKDGTLEGVEGLKEVGNALGAKDECEHEYYPDQPNCDKCGKMRYCTCHLEPTNTSRLENVKDRAKNGYPSTHWYQTDIEYLLALIEELKETLSEIENNVIADSKEEWRDACLEKIKIAYKALSKLNNSND